MLQIGSVVDRKYKILSEIGHGGMSVVYLAINERANKTWAIKEVRKDGVVDFEAVKQGLVAETDMLKKLNHPHLPSIIDVIDTDDSFLIVMDYIEGKSLQSVLRHGGAQPQEQVVEWGKQLCDVLSYLHTRQPPIIYRDMKPANVMLKPDGNITLIDFGTAREFKNRAMVEDTTCLGTRGYAAPEQFGGQGQTDARTDIYCLGATLYHLLTGHSPADPPYEIKPLSYWDAGYAGTGMEKLIAKCCQQDPNARYQSCEELMYALEHLKDEDDLAIRTRKRKWASFVVSVAVCAVGLLGMLGFGLAKSNTQRQTYDYYTSLIPMQSTVEEARQMASRAIDINDGRPEAYAQFMDYVMKDATLSADEGVAVQQLFSEGNRNALRSTSPAAYDEMMFNIGYSYFFFGGHTDKAILDSAKYLGVAASSKNLKPEEVSLSGSLFKIADNYQALKNGTGSKYMKDLYDYSSVWEDLESIATYEMERSLSRPIYAVALYSEVAYLINTHCNDFYAARVDQNRIEAVLQSIDDGLTRLNSEGSNSSFLADEIAEARDNLNAARAAIRSFYK